MVTMDKHLQAELLRSHAALSVHVINTQPLVVRTDALQGCCAPHRHRVDHETHALHAANFTRQLAPPEARKQQVPGAQAGCAVAVGRRYGSRVVACQCLSHVGVGEEGAKYRGVGVVVDECDVAGIRRIQFEPLARRVVGAREAATVGVRHDSHAGLIAPARGQRMTIGRVVNQHNLLHDAQHRVQGTRWVHVRRKQHEHGGDVRKSWLRDGEVGLAGQGHRSQSGNLRLA